MDWGYILANHEKPHPMMVAAVELLRKRLEEEKKAKLDMPIKLSIKRPRD